MSLNHYLAVQRPTEELVLQPMMFLKYLVYCLDFHIVVSGPHQHEIDCFWCQIVHEAADPLQHLHNISGCITFCDDRFYRMHGTKRAS